MENIMKTNIYTWIISLIFITLNTNCATSQILWEKFFVSNNKLSSLPPLYSNLERFEEKLFLPYIFNRYVDDTTYYTNTGFIVTDLSGDKLSHVEFYKNFYLNLVKIYKSIGGFNLFLHYVPSSTTSHRTCLFELNDSYDIIQEKYGTSFPFPFHESNSAWLKDSIYSFFFYPKFKGTVRVFDYSLNVIREIALDSTRPSTIGYKRAGVPYFFLTKNKNFLFYVNMGKTEDYWSDAYLNMLDNNGKKIWSKHINISNRKLTLYKIIETKSAEFIAYGLTLPDIDEEILKSRPDSLLSIILIKLNSQGDVQWFKEYPAQYNQLGNNFSYLEESDRYAIYGRFNPTGYFYPVYNPKNIVYLFNNKLDLIYKYAWSTKDSVQNQIDGVVEKGDNLIVYGRELKKLSEKPLIEFCQIYLAELKPEITSVEDNPISDYPDLWLYPDPADEVIKLNCISGEPNGRKIRIFSIEGVLVLETDYADQINVSHLASAVYFLMLDGRMYKFLKI